VNKNKKMITTFHENYVDNIKLCMYVLFFFLFLLLVYFYTNFILINKINKYRIKDKRRVS